MCVKMNCRILIGAFGRGIHHCLGGCSAVKHMFAKHGLSRRAELVLSLSGAPELRR